jgi:hypothetical protein
VGVQVPPSTPHSRSSQAWGSLVSGPLVTEWSQQRGNIMAGEQLRVRVPGYGDITVDCQGNLGGNGWTATSDAGMPEPAATPSQEVAILDGTLKGQTASARIELTAGRLTLTGLSGFHW